MTTPHPAQVNIVVRDMEASRRFYELVGLQFRTTPPEWRPHHAAAETSNGLTFELDSIRFAKVWDKGWKEGGRGSSVMISFMVSSREEVDRIVDRVKDAGYPIQQEPYDAFWGARYAVVEDPDGNAVGITSAIDPERGSAPPML